MRNFLECNQCDFQFEQSQVREAFAQNSQFDCYECNKSHYAEDEMRLVQEASLR